MTEESAKLIDFSTVCTRFGLNMGCLALKSNILAFLYCGSRINIYTTVRRRQSEGFMLRKVSLNKFEIHDLEIFVHRVPGPARCSKHKNFTLHTPGNGGISTVRGRSFLLRIADSCLANTVAQSKPSLVEASFNSGSGGRCQMSSDRSPESALSFVTKYFPS